VLNDANSLYVCTVEHNLKVGDILVFKTYGADESGQHMIIVHDYRCVLLHDLLQ